MLKLDLWAHLGDDPCIHSKFSNFLQLVVLQIIIRLFIKMEPRRVHIVFHFVLVCGALQINNHVSVKEVLVAPEEVLAQISSWALHMQKLHSRFVVGHCSRQLDAAVRLH